MIKILNIFEIFYLHSLFSFLSTQAKDFIYIDGIRVVYRLTGTRFQSLSGLYS